MRIGKVSLENFRNYSSETVVLGDGLNVFCGKNASGKTNFAESLYLCALGKSPRTAKDREMILWGSERAQVRTEVIKKYRGYEISVAIEKNDKKKVSLDGIPASRMSELVGILNVVYFSPDELKLIKESPAERRRFIDISLCQQSRNYLFNLQKYNDVLMQRNKLLKSGFGAESLKRTLPVWDAQLAVYGAYIVRKRYEFIEKLKDYAEERHSSISGETEKLKLSYECFIPRGDKEDTEREFASRLEASLDKDMSLLFTTAGCHRDDLSITLDGTDVRKFGSQGQQRTAALALKFAEIDLFGCELGEKPVLLLDDVLSELDGARRKKLLEMSAGMQTVLTCTEFSEDADCSVFSVSNGKISAL